jgi:hypothetical protein
MLPIFLLALMRSAAAVRAPPPPSPAPPANRTRTAGLSCAGMTDYTYNCPICTFLLRVPAQCATAPPKSLPMVVFLHGVLASGRRDLPRPPLSLPCRSEPERLRLRLEHPALLQPEHLQRHRRDGHGRDAAGPGGCGKSACGRSVHPFAAHDTEPVRPSERREHHSAAYQRRAGGLSLRFSKQGGRHRRALLYVDRTSCG